MVPARAAAVAGLITILVLAGATADAAVLTVSPLRHGGMMVRAEPAGPRAHPATTLPQLSLTKSVASHQVEAGAQYTYTFTLTNTGTGDSGTVVIEDSPDLANALAAGKISDVGCEFVGPFPPGTNLFFCTGSPDLNPAQMGLDNLGAGQSITASYTAVALEPGTSVFNQAQIYVGCKIIPDSTPCGTPDGQSDDPSTPPVGDATVVDIMASGAQVPTLDVTGLVALIVMLAAAGTFAARRREHTLSQ